MKCIQCNIETDHAICESCADELLDTMSTEDLVAHALVGIDAINGKDKLLERLKDYKQKIKEVSNES